MQKIGTGLVAGFIATVVLSVMMIAKNMMGIMPELDVIGMLSTMMGSSAMTAWLGHFMIGTLAWGGGFALLYGLIPGGSALAKGIAFGIAAWLGMMVTVMPMAGAGLFGMGFGIMAPMMTLVLHVIFGSVLGAVFHMLAAPSGDDMVFTSDHLAN
ncbi:putative membrane protein YagU involved in acid resistance [Mesorhizobium jarvisii]